MADLSSSSAAPSGAPPPPSAGAAGSVVDRKYGDFLLEVEDLAVSRGGQVVAEGVGFSLAPGGWLELRGPNGGGKTSLLRCLAGLARADAGRIVWREADAAPQATTRGRCAWLGHLDGLQPHFTVAETLRFWAAAGPGLDPWEAGAALGLERFADAPVRRLSAGWRRRTGLARLILLDRPLWLLDEPFANLDDRGVGLAEGVIARHLARGGACIAAAHGAEVKIEGGRILRLETA